MSVITDLVQLTIRGGQGYIAGVPIDLEKQFKALTSYRPTGYKYAPAYKSRKWDGWIRLVKYSKFPVGLTERITEFFQAHDVAVDIWQEDPDDKPDLNGFSLHGIEHRDYQIRAQEIVAQKVRGVLRAPTGAGKTLMAMQIIEVRNKRTLIVVPTIDLLYQFKSFLQRHTSGVPIGQLGDGVVDPQEITVATIRTAAKAMDVAFKSYEYGEYDDKDDTQIRRNHELREWIDSIGVLIVDEAHILGADTVYHVATKLGATYKYGFSASPWRDDGADLMIEAACGPIIQHITTKELVDQGYLVPPIIHTVSTEGMWTPAAWKPDQWAKCYQDEIVNNSARNEEVARQVNALTVPTLVLVKQIKHGRHLELLIPGSVFLSGKDHSDHRVDVMEQIRTGELRVLICTVIVDMGIDIPSLGAVVLAGGGKASTRHLQRIGRGARPFPGKEYVQVIDFDDTHVHDWFHRQIQARRLIEVEEWGSVALWW